MSTDVQSELSDLEAKRRHLALDVIEGRPGAAEELDQVEDAIDRLRRREEHLVLAEQERVDRDATARAVAGAQRQRELDAQREALLGQRPALAKAIDVAADRLVTALEAMRAHHAAVTALNQEMGTRDVGTDRLLSVVDRALSWQLSGFLKILSRPEHFYRKRLAELVSGPAKPGE